MTIYLGLLGRAGDGKSTAAEFLEQNYIGVKRYAFAHPLKKLIREAFGVPKEAVWGTQAEKEMPRPEANGYSGRDLMQRIGDAVRNTFGENFWVDLVFAEIKKDAPVFAVIEDVRYSNEAAAIPGIVCRLDNPNRMSTADPKHPSEIGYRSIDADITLRCATVEALFLSLTAYARSAGLKKKHHV